MPVLIMHISPYLYKQSPDIAKMQLQQLCPVIVFVQIREYNTLKPSQIWFSTVVFHFFSFSLIRIA